MTPKQLERVVHSLRITPIALVVVIAREDVPLAKMLCDEVRQILSLSDAFDLAKSTDEPTVIVTGDIELNAYFSDGHTETIT